MRLTMYVGLPASGKTTHAKHYAEATGAVYLSSDAIRYELYGDENIQGDPTKVFRIMEHRTIAALRDGKSVVYDATNLNAKKRANFIGQMKSAVKDHIEFYCHLMVLPYEECLERDAARERHVGEEVLHRMLCRFQCPFYNEGWNEIRVFGLSDHDGAAAYLDELSEKARGYDQRNSHHTLSLFDHMSKTARYVDERVDLDEEWFVIMAAAWHDIGKLDTQSIDEDGEAHYYDHQCASAYRFLCGCPDLMPWDDYCIDDVLYAASLITWHMQHYQCGSADALLEWCFKRGFSARFAKYLIMINEADKAAH